MGAKGITLAQEAHSVLVRPPVDINGAGVTGVRFSMADYAHATIYVLLGVTGAASTLTIEAQAAASGGSGTALTFKYFAETTAAGDTLGAVATSASLALSTNDGVFYVVEIDASELPDGKPWISVLMTDPSAATLACVLAVLTGSRYASDQNLTAIV